MSVEQNKALVRQFASLVNAKDLEAALALLRPDFVEHGPEIGLPTGIEGVRAFFMMQFAAFPDWHSTLLDVMGEGDKVVCRMNGEGTHQGVFLGVPPAGKRINSSFIDIWRVADGKLAEHWVEADLMGVLRQLDIVPSLVSR